MNDNYQSIRDQIVATTDIVNIISQYVKLEKKGNNYIGLCPFHNDTSPSMSVSPTKKIFKCFSCNTGGDVITFLCKFKNISYYEALKELAEAAGINIVKSQKDIFKEKNQKYYDIVNEAVNFFHFYLQNGSNNAEALQYLHNRFLTDDIIDKFKIGCSGNENELFKVLSSKEYLPMNMIEVGLVRSDNKNKYYDIFKNRIIFPIKDNNGNYVGVSGRLFQKNNDQEAKYVNTNENIIFKKREILYNFYDSIADIKAKNQVYLFEGYMDVIAAYRANVYNAVASMGTNLTVEQIQAIKRITKNVIVCYDNDTAGESATMRAIDMLLHEKINVSVVRIEDVKDADEYINEFGKEKLFTLLNDNIVPAIEFIYNKSKKELFVDDINSIETFKNRVFKYLKILSLPIVTDVYIKKLEKDLKIDYEILNNDYNNNINNNNINYNDDIKEHKQESKNQILNMKTNRYVVSEQLLIKYALLNKTNCYQVEHELNFSYVLKENRDLFLEIYNYYKNHDTFNEEIFKSLLNEDMLKVYEIIKSVDMYINFEELFDKLIQNIKLYQNEKSCNEIKKQDIADIDLKKFAEMKRKTTRIN